MNKENKTKFKTGDKVRVRKDLKQGFGYETYVNEEMEKYKGQVMTIKSIENGRYILKEATEKDSWEWRWTDDMLEDVIFTTNDLQFGDILTLRNGERYVYASDRMYREKDTYSRDGDSIEVWYHDNLTQNEGNKDQDIVKVERKGDLIFERKDARKVTMKDVCEKFGEEVEIVREVSIN